MLVARPAKRDGGPLFDAESHFEILKDDEAVGRLDHNRASGSGRIALGETRFSLEKIGTAENERALLHGIARLVTGAQKPPPDRHQLKDGAGALVAEAEQTREVFQITHADTRYRFAKGRSALLFDLAQEGRETPFGSVGQKKFLTKLMHMDLPDTFDPAFQVFLLHLLLLVIYNRGSDT